MAMDLAVRQRDDIRVVEAAILALLDQPRADGKPKAVRETRQGLNGWTGRNRLGERLDRAPLEVAHMPVAGHAHLGERDDQGAAARSVLRERLDHGEVVRLVAGSMLKLRRRAADHTHPSSLAARRSSTPETFGLSMTSLGEPRWRRSPPSQSGAAPERASALSGGDNDKERTKPPYALLNSSSIAPDPTATRSRGRTPPD